MSALDTRIPPPLVAAVCAGLMWLIAQALTAPAVSLSGAVRGGLIGVLVCAAVVVAVSAAWHFRQSRTTINPHTPDATSTLVTGGVYRWTRNPMYLGLALLLAAWGVYLLSLWSLLGVAGFVVYLNRFQIGPEEQALHARFGETFVAYCASVRRWI